MNRELGMKIHNRVKNKAKIPNLNKKAARNVGFQKRNVRIKKRKVYKLIFIFKD